MSSPAEAGASTDSLPPVTRDLWRVAVRAGETANGLREVAEEVAVALTYGGGTHAVMMATPADLEDFAVGFSLTEQIVAAPSDIRSLDIVPTPDGIDIQMWLADPPDQALAARRRHLAGATGCGLCGVDSIAEAMRRPPAVPDRLRLSAHAIADAIASLPPHQDLYRRTGAVHAAAFWHSTDGLACIREDVGRHNALDKLVGALARRGAGGTDGVLLLTSRVSVEMVQKAAVLGAEVLVAVSAPTALAVRVAEAAGITLVGIARADGFELFTHAHRITAATPPRRTSVEARPQLEGVTTSAPPALPPARAGGLLSVEYGLAIVLEGLWPISGDEDVALCATIGRMAALSVATPICLPRFDHSAMDGYGIALADCGGGRMLRLELVGRVLAGGAAGPPVGAGETVRLLTGAPVPDGVAAVVMEEHCRVLERTIVVDRAVAAGLNIRRRGEDAPAGTPIAAAGDVLRFGHLPILAACGIETLRVRRRLRVALLSTGDEIAAPGAKPGESGIHDVNRALLRAVLDQPWIEVADLGTIGDAVEPLADLLCRAAANADAIVTSGGVSGGDADHLSAAIEAAGGTARTLRLAVKPGKPLLVGAIGEAALLGLPGNPRAALADMLLFGRSLLNRRAGRPVAAKHGLPATVAAPLSRKPGRTELVPAAIAPGGAPGALSIALQPSAGSARLHPLAHASGLAILPATAETLEAGDIVAFIPFSDPWAGDP